MLNKMKSSFAGKKVLVFLSTLLVLLSFPLVVLAQRQESQVRDLKSQIQTQNQDEIQELQVITQKQGNLQEGQAGDIEEAQVSLAKGQPKLISPRSENAREHMSVVAQTVEELLTTQEARGGIGQEISAVAKEQKQAQGEIEDEFDKLDARKGWVKKLFGPDYKAIKNLKRQTEKNQLRIQQLEQLQTKVGSRAEQTQIQEAVQAFVGQNTALEEQIQAEEKVGSLLGWLLKLFAK